MTSTQICVEEVKKGHGAFDYSHAENFVYDRVATGCEFVVDFGQKRTKTLIMLKFSSQKYHENSPKNSHSWNTPNISVE